MKQDEAEKLARELLNSKSMYVRPLRPQIERLCNFILSGDMRREIENAAFERAANTIEDMIGEELDFPLSEGTRRIRAFIQPPAQKEDGE